MPISPDQLRRRRERIGSSDSPPIVGVNPWKNAADVFLEKTQDVGELAAKEAIEIGDAFEAPLLLWAGRELGVEVRPNVEALARHDAIMAANHDGLVIGRPQGLEAKTGTGTDYGAEGTDEVPERVIVQCQHQMYVSELELVWVPVLIAKFDRMERVMYKVPRNEKLIGQIVERDHAFWENHVLTRIPPQDMAPSMSVLQRLRRIPDKLAEVDPDLVAHWQGCRAARKAMEGEEEEALRLLVAALGDASGAEFGHPSKILTFQGYSYSAVDGKALKMKRPDVWEEFKKEIVVSPFLKEVNRR